MSTAFQCNECEEYQRLETGNGLQLDRMPGSPCFDGFGSPLLPRDFCSWSCLAAYARKQADLCSQ